MKPLVNGINIAVRDLEYWTHRYEQVLGISATPVDEEGFAFPGLQGASFNIQGFGLNLISSTDSTTSVGRFLERRGDGVFLLSLKVEDVDAASAELREMGIEPLLERPARGDGHAPVNFVHPREMAGVQFEFIELD